MSKKSLLVILILSFSLLTSTYEYTPAFSIKFIKDPDLKAELVVKGLRRPTGLIFTSQNEMLVSQHLGKVQRIDKNLSEPPQLDAKSAANKTILDLTPIINSTGERGVLGIDSSQINQVEQNASDSKVLKVFLIFTRVLNATDLNNVGCILKKCNIGNFVNSIYEYEYRDGKLVNPKLLLDVPIYSNSSIQHIGGAFTVNPKDNRIYVTSGDGRGCEFKDCDFDSIYLANSTGTKRVGGIYDIFAGVQSDDYNATSGQGLDQYAYGIRNSFGLDFDPVTGNLWDTENGPTFGDEINLVKRGFNSGWPLVQGVWPIEDDKQLSNNPAPDFPKGYFFSENSHHQNSKKVSYGLANYSDPEFAWNQSVGVTAMKFFNSDKLGKEYENDLFVGTYQGDIYHFDLNKERDGFLLKGPLKDKVANNEKELRPIIFSRGLSSGIGITDLEIGPDGYLYVVAYSTPGGAIFKIVPK